MPPAGPHNPFASSASCQGCHATIYAQWSKSMHSHALTSPVTIAQTNQVVKGPFASEASPDPLRFCINCHSPTAAAVTTTATLPQDAFSYPNEGVSCIGCHQFNGDSSLGGAGVSTGFLAALIPGSDYFAALDTPIGNSLHGSMTGKAYQRTDDLCANCHDVNYDRNHDGQILKGVDLVLQQTFDEYLDYQRLGGQETCISCHMPVIPGLTRAADGASIPSQQFADAPPRQVHDHSFVGVDYALDDPAQSAAQNQARTGLLRSAAAMSINRNSVTRNQNGVSFSVSVSNTGAGHNIPTGFAFTRQVWLEVTATDAFNVVQFSSGLLANPSTDDLCDSATLNEQGDPMIQYVQGCNDIDQQLVTFQQKLVDKVAIELDGNGFPVLDQDGQPVLIEDFFGHETWLQYLAGGVVARQRGIDGTNLGAIPAGTTKTFLYTAPVNTPLHVSVRLLFRNLPPYFLRALAAGQPASEMPQVAPLISNVAVVEMATDAVDVQ
jgi:hypothetical protein